MHSTGPEAVAAFALTLLGGLASAQTLAPITTRSGNNLRAGVYQDSVLTPSAVESRGLRVYFRLAMEGDARGTESQMLVAPDIKVQDGRKRNLCIVSALNNLVWAYDCVDSDIVWVQKLGIPVKSNPSIDYWGNQDHFGVLSTGVLDLNGDSGVWYGVGWGSPDGSPAHGKHFIYGLSLRDGSFAFPPVQMPVEYDAIMRKQRSSLALANLVGRKVILFGSGTFLETSAAAAGYLTTFDVASRHVTLLPMAKQGGGSGIWMSGSGLVVDEAKQAIFGVTGNGTFNPDAGDWAETVFRASYDPARGLRIEDWWTGWLDSWRAASAPKLEHLSNFSANDKDEGRPVNRMHLSAMPRGASMADEDLGSAPCTYIPQYAELLCAGKDSIGYVVSAENMGKTQLADLSSPAGIATNYARLLWPPFWYGTFAGYDQSPAATTAGALNSSVWFDGLTNHVHMASVVDGDMLYVGAENSNVRSWRANPDHSFTFLANSDDVASPDLAGKPPGGMTGWFCAASTSGILACTRPHGDANKTVTQGDLFVFDSRNFETRADGSRRIRVLWRSDQHGITLTFNKFCPPVILSNGTIAVETFDGNVGTLMFGLN